MENNKLTDSSRSKEKLEVINQIKEIYNFIRIKKFCRLIPEVRTNIAGALQDPKTMSDVAGIDGRITVVNGLPKAAGDVKFGAAEHTARLLLTANEFDNSVNFVMNLRYSPETIKDIQKKSNLVLEEILREKEPRKSRDKEYSTMQWLIKQSIVKTGRIPDIIWDKGSIGKEPMIRLFGKDSVDIIEKLRSIIDLINDD